MQYCGANSEQSHLHVRENVGGRSSAIQEALLDRCVDIDAPQVEICPEVGRWD
jgi:hypothetical protein